MQTATYGDLVAEEVRALAARRRISGRQIAREMGVTPMTVSRLMTGRHVFDVNELAAFARVLDVPVEALLPHLDSNQKPAGLQAASVAWLELAA